MGLFQNDPTGVSSKDGRRVSILTWLLRVIYVTFTFCGILISSTSWRREYCSHRSCANMKTNFLKNIRNCK